MPEKISNSQVLKLDSFSSDLRKIHDLLMS